MGNENVIICGRCSHSFRAEEFEWNEHGTGYSTKLAVCPECGRKVVVEFVEDYSWKMMGKFGLDPRYYDYRKGVI